MVWRRLLKGWSSQTAIATEEPDVEVGENPEESVSDREIAAPAEPTSPEATRPRFGGFSFEAPSTAAGATMEAPTPPAVSAAVDMAAAVRRKTRRKVRVSERGVGPVMVPSLREQALVYRMAAESRAHAEPRTSLELWKVYLELCPTDGDAWFLYGQCLLTTGHLDAAWGAFVETRRHDPTHGLAAGALGYLSAARGDHDDALRHYRDAVALRGRCLDMLRGLAAAQDATGRVAEAAATRARITRITDAD